MFWFLEKSVHMDVSEIRKRLLENDRAPQGLSVEMQAIFIENQEMTLDMQVRLILRKVFRQNVHRFAGDAKETTELALADSSTVNLTDIESVLRQRIKKFDKEVTRALEDYIKFQEQFANDFGGMEAEFLKRCQEILDKPQK